MPLSDNDTQRTICSECAEKGGLVFLDSIFGWYLLNTSTQACYVCGSMDGKGAQLFCFRVQEDMK